MQVVTSEQGCVGIIALTGRIDATTASSFETSCRELLDSGAKKVVVDLGVAGTAKAHQIVPCMSAALRDGNDVVYLIHRSQPSFLETHLAERMRRSVSVTDAFPCSAVFLIYVRTAFVFVVLPAGGCFMLLAVLALREVGTAGVGTGALGFSWHRFTSLGHKKSLHRTLP